MVQFAPGQADVAQGAVVEPVKLGIDRAALQPVRTRRPIDLDIRVLIAFHAAGQPETTCLYLPGQRLSQYLFWADPSELAGRDGLAVLKSGRKIPEIKRLFAKVELIDQVELTGPTGKIIHRLELYRCQDFKGADARPARFLK